MGLKTRAWRRVTAEPSFFAVDTYSCGVADGFHAGRVGQRASRMRALLRWVPDGHGQRLGIQEAWLSVGGVDNIRDYGPSIPDSFVRLNLLDFPWFCGISGG